MEHKIVKNLEKSININQEKTTSKPIQNLQEPEYDLVNFYLQPELIQMISQQLAGQPKVNFNKVNQIQQQIENNAYNINPIEVADKIINFETDLFKS